MKGNELRPAKPVSQCLPTKARKPAANGIVMVLLLSTVLAADGAATIVPVLQTTFTNPTPAASDDFGKALAVMGNDRVVIGAPGDDDNGPGDGAAYLFNVNGTLLTDFLNDHLSMADWGFGQAVAPLGDYVYIGARYDYSFQSQGMVYICSTNDWRSRCFWNTNYLYLWDLQDNFGASVAALGNDRLIVGAPDAGAVLLSPLNGAVFLYSNAELNNMPLTTITNPFPSSGTAPDRFGFSVAAIGADRILIGAPQDGRLQPGKAYLFSTNGSLVTSFTNPAAARGFGYTVAALGNDRVLIGAPNSNPFNGNSGRAFLFSTNGTLLVTFANPVPTNSSARLFGNSVAAVGNDRVLIGAPQGHTNIGAAFLFSTNGTLLATLTNPTGATNTSFGISVVAAGSNRVLIGDTAGLDGGAAYLFSLLPTLDIQPTPTNTLVVSWSSLAPDFSLQQNTDGLTTENWSYVSDLIQSDGTNKYIIVDPATGNRFYRLIKP